MREDFENSRMVASKFLFRTFDESDSFNMTMEATRGWVTKNLTIYTSSSYQSPIIFDTILFQINGSVSLQINEPHFLFMTPQNLNTSVVTGRAESAFFIADLGKSLLIDNVTSASSSFPSGDLDIMFDVIYGNISVSDGNLQFNLDNSDNRILIHLEAHIIADVDIQFTGKFAVESNTYSALTIECWSAPITAYFGFPNGFLSYGESINELSGSQNLNLTEFKGEIILLNSQQSDEISIQGYAERIYLGTTELTAPNFLRDYGNVFNIFISSFVTLLLTSIPVYLLNRRKEREEIKKTHLKEFKDNLFTPLLRYIEKSFKPQINLRNSIDYSQFDLNCNLRLIQDVKNHFPTLDSRIQNFRQLVERYNEKRKRIKKMVYPLIVKAMVKQLKPTRMLMLKISIPTDKGGASVWAFKLLLGVNTNELEKILDVNQKDEGLEILIELQQNVDVAQEVTGFKELCGKLETSLTNLMEELNRLMKVKRIGGKCDIIGE